MLRLMLDAHADVAIPGESHFIPEEWRRRGRFTRRGGLDAVGLAQHLLSNTHVARWGVPEASFIERVHALNGASFADVVACLYWSYADVNGKRRWGDKTPSYVLHIPLLVSLFPEARFVHLIRDGRDVALSYLDRPRYPRTIWQAAWRWKNAVTSGRRFGATLDRGRYTEVRYEALVQDPEGVLREVCAFLRLPYDARMLLYSERAGDRLEVAPEMEPYQMRSTRPPQVGVRDWRRDMSHGDLRAFELVAGQLLSELGYERAVEGTSLEQEIAALRVFGVRSRLVLSRGKHAAVRVLTD